MKMLSDLLIGHNWPINGHFFVKLTKKINWLKMSCIAFGYQKKGIDPNISGKKSLAHSNIRISSYRRFKMSAYGKQAENVSFINFRPLWPCLHLKKCNFILVLIKLVSGQIGKIWLS